MSVISEIEKQESPHLEMYVRAVADLQNVTNTWRFSEYEDKKHLYVHIHKNDPYLIIMSGF